MTKCVFCGNELKESKESLRNYYCECPFCGDYSISHNLNEDYPNENSKIRKNSFKVSSFIREYNLQKRAIPILVENCDGDDDSNKFCLENIFKKFPKTIDEKIDKIMMNLYKLSEYDGSVIIITPNDAPIFYISNYSGNEMEFVINTLISMKYIEFSRESTMGNPKKYLRIAIDGLKKIENMQRMIINSKYAFVAMRFSEKYNKKYQIIKKAIEETNHEALRVDKEEHIDKICDRIIYDIKRSKFIVCDLEEQNQGVYFEAGFAKGLDKKVIWLCPQKDLPNIHFDTRQYNMIVYENEDEIFEKLKDRILAIFGTN